jgi:DNA polymerase-3 subunit delta
MDSLFRSLNKGSLAPVYYFHGAEDVLKDEAVRAILDRALDPSVRDFNFDQRSAGQLDAEMVHSLCNTLPMLADRRVVLLRDVENWKRKTAGRSEFLRYLERPCPETVVILVQGSGEDDEDKELAKGAYTVRFDALPPERASRWVLHRAGQLGLVLEPDAVEHLVRSVGSDLGPLASELAKLASLPADEPLTVERVAELVGVRSGETQWDWRAAVLDDQSGRAVTLLPALLAQPGVTGVKLVSLLGSALVGVGIARGLYDKGSRGGALEDAVLKTLFKHRPAGLGGYRDEASRWSRWAPRWSLARLRAALRAALETDQALKNTTVSDEHGLLTELVMRLGMSRRGGEGGEGGKDGGGRSGQSGTSGTSGKVSAASSSLARQMAGTVSRVLLVTSTLSAFSAFSAFSASAQTDPRLIEVIRSAQEGQGDSARAKVQRLLAATSPGDTLYPQIIYTQAMVASDAADMRRQLQRVAVEYSSSNWADDALLRLVQLDYASGNLDGAARNLERIRRDYPGSALLPQAAYWAARTYFDQRNPGLACRWVADGLAASQGNVELQNQLGYLNQRCSSVAVAGPRPAADSQTAVATAAPDTSTSRSDTTRHPRAPTPSPTPAPTATPAPTPAPPPPPTPTATRPDTVRADSAQPIRRAGRTGPRFRIQITAVRSAAAAESIAAKLKARGLRAMTVEEGGLYKVRVGEYASKAEAVAAVPEIKAKVGGSPFVVTES